MASKLKGLKEIYKYYNTHHFTKPSPNLLMVSEFIGLERDYKDFDNFNLLY